MVFNITINLLFHLYRGGQIYWRRKPEYLQKTTPVASHWQTLSYDVYRVQLAMSGIQTHNFSGDRH